MLLDQFEQQPREVRVRRIDFSARLLTGETILGVSAYAERRSGDTDDSATPFIVGGVVTDGARVTYTALGGADGNSYKLTFTTNTSTPQIREDEIIIKVKEL